MSMVYIPRCPSVGLHSMYTHIQVDVHTYLQHLYLEHGYINKHMKI